MAEVVVNNLTGTVVATDQRAYGRRGMAIERIRQYNRKSNRSRSKLRTMALFLIKHYDIKRKAFITITTKQHETGFRDSDLISRMGKVLRSRLYFGNEYICVCERQRNTSDLHFHILTVYDSVDFFDYKRLRRKCAKSFGIRDHPAILQVDWIEEEDSSGVARYMAKLSSYVSKESGEDAPYSSIFYCRTYTISKHLKAEFRKVANRYVLGFSSDFLLRVKDHLKLLHRSDFFCVYRNTPYIWDVAQQWSKCSPPFEDTILNKT